MKIIKRLRLLVVVVVFFGGRAVLFIETGIPNSSYACYNNEIISGMLSVGTNKSRHFLYFFLHFIYSFTFIALS